MEYTQWDFLVVLNSTFFVLILVVMEYTQWDKPIRGFIAQEDVLILVVMEYTQWD